MGTLMGTLMGTSMTLDNPSTPYYAAQASIGGAVTSSLLQGLNRDRR
jgi:hypothetical protein